MAGYKPTPTSNPINHSLTRTPTRPRWSIAGPLPHHLPTRHHQWLHGAASCARTRECTGAGGRARPSSRPVARRSPVRMPAGSGARLARFSRDASELRKIRATHLASAARAPCKVYTIAVWHGYCIGQVA